MNTSLTHCAKFKKRNWFYLCWWRLLILLSYHNNARENEDRVCINTQTNKHTLWCYKVERPVFIAASVSQLQRETQTCRNLWRPNLNLPRILFNTNNPHTYTYTHRNTLTLTCRYHCSAPFSLKTGNCDTPRVLCLNVCVFISACVGTVYIHTHTCL